MTKLDLRNLEQIVTVLSQGPDTISEFESLYRGSTGDSLYDNGVRSSDKLVELLSRQKGTSKTQALATLESLQLTRNREPNYIQFSPSEITQYDMPKALGKGANLLGVMKRFGDGILIVDLRSKEVSYFSEHFDITKGPGQYRVPPEWSIKRYCLELRATEE
jgi:hypothetical protein